MAYKKLSTNESIADFISRLPDDVLCHILSFLQTKEALVTSVLSTRWRYLFRFLTSLDFDDSFLDIACNECDDCMTRLAPIFVSFVNQILKSLEVPKLDKFRLDCSFLTLPPPAVHFWISHALTLGVRELDLSISNGSKLFFPRTMFNSNSLVVLKLCGIMFIDIPTSVHLPSLKSLYFMTVPVGNMDPIKSLVSGCPVLEDLDIDNCLWDIDSKEINISSLTLKRFKFSYCCFGENKLKLVVDAPSLLELRLSGDPTNGYSMNNLQSLCTAEVNMIEYPSDGPDAYRDEILGLVKAVCHVKTLTLPLYNFWSHEDFLNALPTFQNVTNLVVSGTNDDGIGRQILDTLLHKLPMLEELVFLHVSTYEVFQPRRQQLGEVEEEEEEEQQEEEPEEFSSDRLVPSCLLSHLRTVKFGEMLDDKRRLSEIVDMVKYFLQNAQVLEKLIIHKGYFNAEEYMEAMNEVLAFPRCSETCQVILHDI